MNSLQYWRINENKFPVLARTARNYLFILAISAPSERIFSRGGDIITKKRNRLTKNTFNQIMCLKDWDIFKEEDFMDISSSEKGSSEEEEEEEEE